MLRVGEKRKSRATCSVWTLLVFVVGGRPVAVRTSEVVSISQWAESIPVASCTPFIKAVVRQDNAVLPVFDLASALRLCVQGNNPLCLRVKHPLGDMVICIDEEMPILQTLESTAVQAYRSKDVPAEGSYASGLDEIPILAIAQLGSSM